MSWVDKGEYFWKTMTPTNMKKHLNNKEKADVQDKKFKRTPLHLVLLHKRGKLESIYKIRDLISLITLLLENDANINTFDMNGNRPLHYAAGFNIDLEIIVELLKNGANLDVNEQNRYQAIPLHWAARFNPNPQVIMTLLNFHSNPSAKDILRKTPFDYARKNKLLKRLDNKHGVGALKALEDATQK